MEPPRNSRVAVVTRDGDRHLFAATPFRAGETILTIDGRLVGRPSRFSIQVGEDLHVDVPPGGPESARWPFLNHSCAPNAVLRERLLVAWRPIAEGEEITFDYNSTEYELATPFLCRCGACDGRRIGGFGRLDERERERLRPMLAAHLRRRLCRPEA